jgi:cyclic pyranopterin phosphate synthase
MTHRFCGSCDRIRVTADGRLKPCLHSATEVNLRGLVGQELVDAMRAGIAQSRAGTGWMTGAQAIRCAP